MIDASKIQIKLWRSIPDMLKPIGVKLKDTWAKETYTLLNLLLASSLQIVLISS